MQEQAEDYGAENYSEIDDNDVEKENQIHS